MRVLVTGANGFVGRALCAELVRCGYEVRCAVREITYVGNLPGELVAVGDIGPETEWGAVLEGVNAVIHLAARVHVMHETALDPLTEFRAVNTAGTQRLAEDAIKQGVRRFVYVSSIKVDGEETTAHPFTENDEEQPIDPYAISKWEAERFLHNVAVQTRLEVVIVRPPLVYGPGVAGNFLRLLRLINWGMPIPLGLVDNHRSMIYLGNFVDALITCTVHSKAAGKTYLVCDGEDIGTSQLILRLSLLMGKSGYLWPFPLSVLRLIGRIIGKSNEMQRLLGSLVVDASKIKRELDWRPPFTIEQGLAETAQWYRESKG